MNKSLITVSAISFLTSFGSMAQTVLYNGGADICASTGSIIYVDGDVVNDVNGRIYNRGDIYLTNDWTNNDAQGALIDTLGTVWLYGTTQSIKGTSPTKFNNLNCENGGKKTLNIDTYVTGRTGILALKTSPFDLNTNTLFLTNPSTGAITRSTGHIVSETDPTAGYGSVRWSFGALTGNYVYPFGTSSGSYIPFTYSITTAGIQTTTGAIEVATYPTLVTANPNNRPLPSLVTNLIDLSSASDASALCADRFWPITHYNFTTQPVANVTFTYTDAEWNASGGSTNLLVEDSLKAWKWFVNQWQLPTVGTCNTTSNTVYVPNVADISTSWTLLGDEPPPPPPPTPCDEMYLPNAFSPNADSKNDVFKLRGNCLKTISLKIYNRWGNLVFETTDITKGWDGLTPDGQKSNPGVYAYEIMATTTDDKELNQKGTVSLIK